MFEFLKYNSKGHIDILKDHISQWSHFFINPTMATNNLKYNHGKCM